MGFRKNQNHAPHESQPFQRLVWALQKRYAQQKPQKVQAKPLKTKQQVRIQRVWFPTINVFTAERVCYILWGIQATAKRFQMSLDYEAGNFILKVDIQMSRQRNIYLQKCEWYCEVENSDTWLQCRKLRLSKVSPKSVTFWGT